MERENNKSRQAGVPWPVVGVLLLLAVAGSVAVVTGVFGDGRPGQGDLGGGYMEGSLGDPSIRNAYGNLNSTRVYFFLDNFFLFL